MKQYMKKSEKHICNEKVLDIIVFLLIIMLVVPYISNLNVPYLDTDEYGYWGSASFFAGYDWSSVISTNSYFSYGYGLILSLLLICIKNPIICFKVSIILNAFFLFGSYMILKKIIIFLDGNLKSIYCCTFSLAATLYCAEVTYAGTSLPECLLAFLFALNVYLVLLFLKTPSYGKCMGIILLSVYMYTVHQRTICVLFINIFFVFGHLLIKPKKNAKGDFIKLIFCLAIFSFFLIGANYLKSLIQSNVWLIDTNGENVTVGNDFSGQIGKIKYLFSCEGIKWFVRSFCGRIFYLIISTYGLIVYFFMYAIRNIVNYQKTIIRIFYIYLFLNIIGAITISCIFLIQPTNTTYLLYGRYCDNIMPVMVVAICLQITQIKKRDIVLCDLIINICSILLTNWILNINIPIRNTSVSQVAISIYYSDGNLNILAIGLFVILILIISIVLIKKRKYLGLAILGTAYILSSVYIGYQAVDTFYTDNTLNDIELVIEIANEIKDRGIEKLCVLVTDDETPGKYDKYGKIIQFINPKLEIYLSTELPQQGEYYTAHIDDAPEDYQVTVLMQNEGYTLGIYEQTQ